MFKINSTTWKQEVKTDKRDELFVEIGDSKQPDFKPQMKICRWGNGDGTNECNVSIRLIEDKDEEKETPTIIAEDGKIKHIKSKRECHFYNIQNAEHPEGASEFEIILRSKPKTNVVQFSIVDKDVKYLHQPVLTEEYRSGFNSEYNTEVVVSETRVVDLEGNVLIERPEHIVGSYVVMLASKRINWTGRKIYRNGQIGIIHRPRMIDASGWEVWGKLNIKNGILSVTIPQDFIDNAVYPIRHAAGLNFGYETQGGSAYATRNTIRGFDADGATGTLDSISAYMDLVNGWSPKMKGCIFLNSDESFFVSGAEVTTVGAGWKVSAVSGSPAISAVSYHIMESGGAAGSSGIYVYGNSGAGVYMNWTYGTFPDPITISSNSVSYSVYATYTAGGGGEAVKPNHLFSLMGCGN